ncbi:hypothetical protein [Jiangella anatolica]|uniref:Phosphodiester glycosidase domain-containing protein n=1 Tax=Jiangella anatolica TaxID=2670374 RepID=A0A2W2BHZ5_9ACTN|nr:hypothetical protein [Jiangella anatolica]PZF79928.1 hypothetical protein C1I92_28665 [Jiangella anatolica]
MSSRSMIGRRLAGRLARIGSAVALAAGLVTVVNFGAAQPASAEQSCPAPTQPPVSGIEHWIEQYSDRGVTVCWGMDNVGGIAQLAAVMQVVDLADGARVQLRSEHICDNGCFDAPLPQTQFQKHTAEEWHAIWAHSTLFSTTNTAYFKDTTNPTTALSLPEFTSGTVNTYGFALNGGSDLTNAKVSLTLGPTYNIPVQSVKLRDFGPVYTAANVNGHWACNVIGRGCTAGFSGTMGFHPAVNISGDPNETKRRTMVGVNAAVNVAGSRVYILTTVHSYKLADARQMLKFFGSQYEMQLDGGGSTQSISAYHQIDSPIFRKVPEVLQVYLGP